MNLLVVVAVALSTAACGRLGFEAVAVAADDEPLRDGPLGDGPLGDGESDDGALLVDAPTTGPRVVQHDSVVTGNGVAVAVPLPLPILAGDVIVVAASTASANGPPTVSDSAGSIYQGVLSGSLGPGEVAYTIQLAPAPVTGTTTVTCATPAVDNLHCHVYVLRGVDGVESTGVRGQVGPALSIDTATATTVANDFLFAFFASNNATAMIAAGVGWDDVEYTVSAANDNAMTQGRLATTVGIQSAEAFASGSGSDAMYVSAMIALRPR